MKTLCDCDDCKNQEIGRKCEFDCEKCAGCKQAAQEEADAKAAFWESLEE